MFETKFSLEIYFPRVFCLVKTMFSASGGIMVKPRFSAQGEIRLQQFLRRYQMPRFVQIDQY